MNRERTPESCLVDFLPVTVRRGNLLRALGYEGQGKLTPRVEELVREGMEEGVNLLRPQGIYTLFPIREVSESGIRVNAEVAFETRLIARAFREAELMAVFIVTIGPEIERKVAQLSREDQMSRGLAYDTFGSEAAESAADLMNEIIEEWAGIQERRTTLRFSPGYCDWSVEEQGKLFSLVDGEKIGVRLSPSSMMIPRKSVSAIVGIGPEWSRKGGLHYPSPCPECPQRSECPNRR